MKPSKDCCENHGNLGSKNDGDFGDKPGPRQAVRIQIPDGCVLDPEEERESQERAEEKEATTKNKEKDIKKQMVEQPQPAIPIVSPLKEPSTKRSVATKTYKDAHHAKKGISQPAAARLSSKCRSPSDEQIETSSPGSYGTVRQPTILAGLSLGRPPKFQSSEAPVIEESPSIAAELVEAELVVSTTTGENPPEANQGAILVEASAVDYGKTRLAIGAMAIVIVMLVVVIALVITQGGSSEDTPTPASIETNMATGYSTAAPSSTLAESPSASFIDTVQPTARPTSPAISQPSTTAPVSSAPTKRPTFSPTEAPTESPTKQLMSSAPCQSQIVMNGTMEVLLMRAEREPNESEAAACAQVIGNFFDQEALDFYGNLWVSGCMHVNSHYFELSGWSVNVGYWHMDFLFVHTFSDCAPSLHDFQDDFLDGLDYSVFAILQIRKLGGAFTNAVDASYNGTLEHCEGCSC